MLILIQLTQCGAQLGTPKVCSWLLNQLGAEKVIETNLVDRKLTPDGWDAAHWNQMAASQQMMMHKETNNFGLKKVHPELRSWLTFQMAATGGDGAFPDLTQTQSNDVPLSPVESDATEAGSSIIRASSIVRWKKICISSPWNTSEGYSITGRSRGSPSCCSSEIAKIFPFWRGKKENQHHALIAIWMSDARDCLRNLSSREINRYLCPWLADGGKVLALCNMERVSACSTLHVLMHTHASGGIFHFCSTFCWKIYALGVDRFGSRAINEAPRSQPWAHLGCCNGRLWESREKWVSHVCGIRFLHKGEGKKNTASPIAHFTRGREWGLLLQPTVRHSLEGKSKAISRDVHP